MSRTQKLTVFALLTITLVLFFALEGPNGIGSKDRNMVGIFSQDEFAQYPHVIRMLRGGETFQEASRKFFNYQHYYYGFPFYFFSSIVLFPLSLRSGDLNQTSTIMLLLRQIISVIPMFMSLGIFVYIQTSFKNFWQSILLFIFLATIPAVWENNFWWHPESLILLFIALSFFFLVKDNFNFKINFWLASISIGLAIGTKLIGLFFFLTIPAYLIWGYYLEHQNIRNLIFKTITFLIIMFTTVVVSNPLLLTSSGRSNYLRIQLIQSEAMSIGWSVEYEKGIQPWLDLIYDSYAPYPLLLISIIAVFLAIILNKNRIFAILSLLWAVPFISYLFLFIVIRPTHFLMPILIPIFSFVAIFFPAELSIQKPRYTKYLQYLSLAFVSLFMLQNILLARDFYYEKVNRTLDEPSINFYNEVRGQYLLEIPDEEKFSVLRDVKTYVADNRLLDSSVFWGQVDLRTVRKNDYDLLFFWRQRILDYTQSGILEIAVDREEMERAIELYQFIKDGFIPGYTLMYQNDFGYFFAKNEVVDRYWLEN